MKILMSLVLTLMIAGAAQAGDMVQPAPLPPVESATSASNNNLSDALQILVLILVERLGQP
jgi:hypothetical protein